MSASRPRLERVVDEMDLDTPEPHPTYCNCLDCDPEYHADREADKEPERDDR